MDDVFRFADPLGPLKLVAIHRPAVPLKAVVAIDNVACGPAIGGVFGHYVSRAAPLYVAAAISLLNFLLASRILPESLAEPHRVSRRLFDFGHLVDAFHHRRLGLVREGDRYRLREEKLAPAA